MCTHNLEKAEPFHPEYDDIRGILQNYEKELSINLFDWFKGLSRNIKTNSDKTFWEKWGDKLLDVLMVGMQDANKTGTKSGANQIGIKLDWQYMRPESTKWARENAGKLVTMVLDDVKEQINTIVSDGLDNGESLIEIKNKISAIPDDENQTLFTPERALRIARTEIIRAHSKGAEIAYQESGVVEGMQWLDGQSGACKLCRDLHNKIVPLGEPFYKDPKFGDGMPPRHPNCRCAVKPVMKK